MASDFSVAWHTHIDSLCRYISSSSAYSTKQLASTYLILEWVSTERQPYMYLVLIEYSLFFILAKSDFEIRWLCQPYLWTFCGLLIEIRLHVCSEKIQRGSFNAEQGDQMSFFLKNIAQNVAQ
jgi:hypothetical protein